VADDSTTATAFKNADALNTAISLAGQDSDNAEVQVPAGLNFTIMPVTIEPLGDEFTNEPVTLTIDGTLTASDDFRNYPLDDDQVKNIFTIMNWDGLHIQGAGVIEGQGFMWWVRDFMNLNPNNRPHMLWYSNVKNIEVSGLKLQNSPHFFVYLSEVLGLYVHDMEIYVDIWGQLSLHQLFSNDDIPATFSGPNGIKLPKVPTFPLNTDGIDFKGENVLIERVKITNFDDSIVAKPAKLKRTG